MSDKISIILTGGTIDSHFDNISESIKVNNRETENTIKDYLDSLALHLDYSIFSVCQKDSREVTDQDREKILKTITSNENTLFLVTHGTYTMPDSARFIKNHAKEFEGKTVIFTGSMVPLKGFTVSDAPFNLGFAIASLLSAKPGVYVAMNGKLFDPDKVYKNIKKGRFEKVTNQET